MLICEMTKTFVLTTGGVLFLALLGGCGSKKPNQPNQGGAEKVHIVSTIFPFTDWAREVGGNHVTVTTLLPNGSSPHTFEPTAAELRHVEKARLFLKAGLGMDDWATRVSAAASSKVEIVSLGDYLKETNQLPQVESAALEIAAGDDHTGHEHHDH